MFYVRDDELKILILLMIQFQGLKGLFPTENSPTKTRLRSKAIIYCSLFLFLLVLFL